MDAFEHAAQRLSKDQSKIRVNRRNRTTSTTNNNNNSRRVTASSSSSVAIESGSFMGTGTGTNNNTTTTTGPLSLSSSRQQYHHQHQKQPSISEKARREAEIRKQEQQQIVQEKIRAKKLLQNQVQYFQECEQALGVQELSDVGSYNADGFVVGQHRSHYQPTNNYPTSIPSLPVSKPTLQLRATSIHGDGDKIALPPSLLEYLTQTVLLDYENRKQSSSASSPWFFRIAIRNPDYKFPSSPLLQQYKFKQEEEDDDDDHSDSEMEEDDDIDNSASSCAAYMDELKYKYLSYTHCTVVEFTQDEGYIGLPRSICDALLLRSSQNTTNSGSSSTNNTATKQIPTTRTIDPSHVNVSQNKNGDEKDPTSMDTTLDSYVDQHEEGTPGHIAYNAFDIPDIPIEISLIQNLPIGKTCRLIPTNDAVQNGFYNLENIKLVLEQSLIRTRATLSIGDTIHTWHRGKKYDLYVDSVTGDKSTISTSKRTHSSKNIIMIWKNYPAVSCINTDIEIEFGSISKDDDTLETTKTSTTMNSISSNNVTNNNKTFPSSGSGSGGGGYKLGSTSIDTTTSTMNTVQSMSSSPIDVDPSPILPVALLPEPPVSNDTAMNIVKIQIRGPNGISGQRRFDVREAKVYDLYQFALSLLQIKQQQQQLIQSKKFQLVTRIPRRVISIESNNQFISLSDTGIGPGQELIMIEHLD